MATLERNPHRWIFTCGGTAGHVNPAIALAQLLGERDPEAEFLFVGADRGLEKDLIPQAGYEPVVYMNLHWAGSMYGMEELAHLPVWLASYGPVPALDRGVTLWQYSESGVVDGIEGPVDLDLWFTKE